MWLSARAKTCSRREPAMMLTDLPGRAARTPGKGLIRRQLKPGEKATFKVDVNDISFIYVHDKRENRYLPVPAVDQVYTKGLTLWQHMVIRNYQRKVPELLVDQNGLATARLRLEQIVEQEMKANKLLSGSEKIARFLNFGMSNYAELIEWEEEEGQSTPDEAGEEPLEELPATSHLAGISDPVTVSPQKRADSSNSESDIEQMGVESVRMYEPDDDIQITAIADQENKGGKKEATKEGNGLSGASKKRAGVGGDIGVKNIPIATEEDDIEESEWESDYDLPVGGISE